MSSLKQLIKNKYKEFLNSEYLKQNTFKLKGTIHNIFTALTPQERMSPDVWADEFRFITKGSRPGKWDSDTTAYLREPARAFIDDSVETIVLMFSTQIGKTAFLENVIGQMIHQNPCPMYFVLPDEAMIRDFKQEKLEDMFESSPIFYKGGLVKKAQPGKSDTNDRKIRFKGGYIAFASSNSMSALAGRSIRILILDEIDRFKVDKTEGDVLVIAKNRTNSYAENRKILVTSTPTDSANSRINKAYLQGDQRKYQIACPHCGHKQFLLWNNIEWEKEKDSNGKSIHKPETAYYRCDLNSCKIEHGHKSLFLPAGEWIPTAKSKDRKLRSYHLSVLYSPFVPYEDVVRDYLAAKDTPGGLRAFFNTQLAEVYDDPAEQPEYEKLYARAETYDRLQIPSGVGFLTCGADVQEKGDGRIEASIWGWGRNNKRWLVDHQVIDGSYKDPETWEKLTELRRKTFTTIDGRELRVLKTLVDSSAGNTTNYVYEYCREYRLDNVHPVKGNSRADSKTVDVGKLDVDSNGKQLRNSINLVKPNVTQLKKWLYHALQEVTNSNDNYYIHLPTFVGKNWFRQLCAEKVVINGTKEEFVKTYANEALDCAIYAHAAAILCGLDRTNWDVIFESVQEQEEKEIKLIELEILKRVQINNNWYEPGDIVEVEDKQLPRLITGDKPFAHETSKKPIVKQEEIQKPIHNRKRKSWFSGR